MPSTLHVIACAALALVVWSAIGWPVARRLLGPSFGPVAPAFAPILGWAIHNAVAVLAFRVVPFDGVAVTVVAFFVAGLSWTVFRGDGDGTTTALPRIPPAAWLAALALATVVAAAVLPKSIDGVIALSDPIFDHSKVALVDDIVRHGMPPGNPFIVDPGHPRLSYYYLLHFSAAQLVCALPLTSWEGDAALTFFAAFTSLAALMAVAVRASGRRAAAIWTVVVAAVASSRVLWLGLIGAATFDGWLRPPKGLSGWMFQAPWVPQHLAATTCVVLAVLLIERLAKHRRVVDALATSLVIAAAFESSTWIGGVAMACIGVTLAGWLVLRVEARERVAVAAALVGVGVIALVAAAPFVVDQLGSASARQSGSPLALAPLDVLGDTIPRATRTWLDVPAFWFVFMPLEFTAAYLCGLPRALATLVRGRDPALRGLAIATLVALVATSCLVSTLADNNDLAWRAGLLAAVLLTPFAAAGLTTWLADRRRIAATLALVAIAIGLPEACLTAARDLRGSVHPSSAAFADAPALWARVRNVARPNERVANNPYAYSDLTPWAVNLSWSLFGGRRSCYATWELVQVYSSFPHDRLREIDDLFVRVFRGDGTKADVDAMATTYDCRVAVLTTDDRAWKNDPFAASPVWNLVDSAPGAWRIYRARVPVVDR